MSKVLYHRVSNYLKTLSGPDFFRKSLSYIKINKVVFGSFSRIKTLYHFKSSNLILGRRVSIKGQIYRVSVGRGVEIYDGCYFEFGAGAELELKDNVLISYGCVIAIREKISIGRNTQIGEYTSVRDSTHSYSESSPIKFQKDSIEKIVIGDDVWIGRGCLILPGTIIEDRVVIGANSVVKGKLEKNKIYGGVPAKFIKER